MNIQLTLSNGTKNVRLKLEDFPSAAFGELINKTFSFLSTNSKGSVAPKVVVKTDQPKAEQKTTEAPASNDVLSLLPEQLREWYREQEKKAAADGKPTFWLTGIKFKDGVPHYKTFYECPNCGDKGKQYVTEDARETDCHQCGSPIDIFPVKGTFPKNDENFNYFLSVKGED